MDEERLVDIETKLAFQEELIQRLNDVVIDQQQQIDRLERLGREFRERLKAIGDGSSEFKPDQEIPPHY